MADPTADGDQHKTVPGRVPRGRRLPTLLLLVALLPILGMIATAVTATQRLEDERRAATDLVDQAAEFRALIDARTAVSEEEVASSVLVVGADLGVDAEALEQMFDQDFVGPLEAARDRVDADPVLRQVPTLRAALQPLVDLRPHIDAGSITFLELLAVTDAVRDAIDAVWDDRVAAQVQRALTTTLPAAAQVRFQALTAAYIALSAAADRALLTEVALTSEPTPAQVAALIDATGSFRVAVGVFPGRLGPAGLVAWERHLDDPAARRFLGVLDDTIASVAAGQEPALRGDPSAFGEAYIDGPAWAEGLSRTVTAAAQDLSDLAADHADDATRTARTQLAMVLLLAALALAAAVLVARSVTGPMRRLEDAAHQVYEGRFDLDPLPERGPRELADTARAFNEMSSTLAAVERHAVALADDADAPVLREQLPGRTGRALQVALNRLRSSMQVAEQRREELERAATHDHLTGLLNRAAAFEVLSRDLLRAGRGGGTVVALYVDLDGLKPINDGHSHAAGDDALRLTADALTSVTRASDVVARLGGDEFLVAGVLAETGDDRAEAEDLAERIRQAVAARTVRVEGAELQLHCTVGIALAQSGSTLESLVNEADAALLQAKRAGRNRIGWASQRSAEGADLG